MENLSSDITKTVEDRPDGNTKQGGERKTGLMGTAGRRSGVNPGGKKEELDNLLLL